MTPTTASPTVRDSIRRANESFIAAFRRGDAAGVASCYSDDATLMPAGSDFVRGTTAIESFWRGAADMGIKDVALETLEVEGSGTTATEVGRYKLLGEGGRALDEGKYLVVWKEEGGGWKLHRDIWNTSRAPSAT